MKKIFLSVIFNVAILLTACSQNNSSTLPVTEYFTKLTSTKNKILVDVRTPGEYSQEHLANAINIDYNGSEFAKYVDTLDKSKPVFIYCLSGGRSGSALKILESKGFKEVYNMQGGIMQWKAKNYPLNNSNPATQVWKGMSKAEYDKIINQKIPVLVDFKAAWCGPCKQLRPILEDIQKEYAGKINIVYIDVDENKSLADEMKISSIPLMVYHKNGKVVLNLEGFSDKASLIKSLKLK